MKAAMDFMCCNLQDPEGPIDTEMCARMFLAQKVPETFLGASDLALV